MYICPNLDQAIIHPIDTIPHAVHIHLCRTHTFTEVYQSNHSYLQVHFPPVCIVQTLSYVNRSCPLAINNLSCLQHKLNDYISLRVSFFRRNLSTYTFYVCFETSLHGSIPMTMSLVCVNVRT